MGVLIRRFAWIWACDWTSLLKKSDLGHEGHGLWVLVNSMAYGGLWLVDH